MKKIGMVGLLSLGLAVTACQHEESNTAVPPIEKPSTGAGKLTDAQYLEILKERGFDVRDARILEEGFMVEGDIYFPRKDLDAISALPKVAQREQGQVAAAAAGRIRIRINPSISAWAAEAHHAINAWNSVQSNVRLNVVNTGAAEIILAADTDPELPAQLQNLPPLTCGAAPLPAGGAAGHWVSVNMDQPTLVNSQIERIANFAHEIGHTLGLHHTNEPSATLINGTPTTDNLSVMNGGNCGNMDANFSDWDRKALLIKYPKDSPLFGMRMKEADSRDDIVVFRPSNGNWYAKYSSSNFTTSQGYPWGTRGDVAISKFDIDGDQRADLAVWRPSDGIWYVKTSLSNYSSSVAYQWGARGDIPLGGMDMDNDGKSDLVVWRWTDGRFYVNQSSSNYTVQFTRGMGRAGDIPVPDTDLDKDGKDDLVIWRPTTGEWFFSKSSSNFYQIQSYQWGAPGDIPVSGTDYDGDGYDDLVVWRPSDGTTYIKTSGSNYVNQNNVSIGSLGSVPVSDIDVNGDGYKDLSVWNFDGGYWSFLQGLGFGSGPVIQWGA